MSKLYCNIIDRYPMINISKLARDINYSRFHVSNVLNNNHNCSLYLAYLITDYINDLYKREFVVSDLFEKV